MSDLNIEGMTIAPGVVETIISLAARDVEGVASIGPATTSGLMDLIGGGRPSTQGIEVTTDENDELLRPRSLRAVRACHRASDRCERLRGWLFSMSRNHCTL